MWNPFLKSFAEDAVRWEVFAVSAVVGLPALGLAATLDATPANYRTQLAALKPGDVLVLAPGTYGQGLPLDAVAGTAQQPIVIRGPEDQSAILTARSCCNTVQLDETSYVEVRNLTLDGLNLDGPFAVDSRGASHHITIENLRILNHGANQQIVGISTKGSAWNWIVRRNSIIRAGTGIYFGNSDGTQPFVGGIIENNLIVDSIGYNLQIKHQLPRPTDVGLPTGPSKTIIRNNVFSKRSNASTGADARPNVLVGHFPLSGAGMDDVYEIYGNFFHENPTEALFQGEGNLSIYGNLFVNSAGSAINVQPQNDRPRAVTILNNTVVASGSGVRVSGGATGTVQRIVGNAVFAATPISGPNAVDNVTGVRTDAANALVSPLSEIGSLDLFPRAGALSATAIDLAPFSAFTDSTLDFNGRTRTGQTRGAYEGGGSNPGWQLALAIKPAAVTVPSTAPTVSLAATPASIPASGSTSLTWSTTNATNCTASGGWSGPRVMTGSEAIGPVTATTAYTLTCTGAGGAASSTANVVVVPVPTVSLSASRTNVPSGSTVTLQWSSTNATSCNASGTWTGTRGTSGTESSAPITTVSTFTLQCAGVSGSGTQAVTVAIDASPAVVAAPAPSASPTTPPAGDSRGGGGAMAWLSLMGLACALSASRRGA